MEVWYNTENWTNHLSFLFRVIQAACDAVKIAFYCFPILSKLQNVKKKKKLWDTSHKLADGK